MKVNQLLERYSITEKRSHDLFHSLLLKIITKKSLSASEAEKLMVLFTSGLLSSTDIAGALTLLHERGEAAGEMASFAKVMRQCAEEIKLPGKRPAVILDTCGTGGGTAKTFNVSTATAFLVASAGIALAKHGNKAITSKAGSADVLEALGVNIHVTPKQMGRLFSEQGISFLFAPRLHKATAQVQQVRKSLPFRTIFNCLGPLSNPLKPTAQVIGVYEEGLVKPMIQAAKALGLERAMVVHGFSAKGGQTMDEVSLLGSTKMAELKNGRISYREFHPKEVGISLCKPEDLQGGTPRQNANIIRAIFTETEKGPKADLVLLNAAAAFLVAGEVKSFKAGVMLSRSLINTEKPLKLLNAYAKATQAVK